MYESWPTLLTVVCISRSFGINLLLCMSVGLYFELKKLHYLYTWVK